MHMASKINSLHAGYLSSADFFFQKKISQKILSGTLGLDLDPDLGPNCLQRLSAEYKCRCKHLDQPA